MKISKPSGRVSQAKLQNLLKTLKLIKKVVVELSVLLFWTTFFIHMIRNGL